MLKPKSQQLTLHDITQLWGFVHYRKRQKKKKYKKFELMLTRCAKAYSSSGSIVTHRSTNRARHRVNSFQSKRIINYTTPPTPVPGRHLVNDIDLRSPKSLKSLTPACAGLHEPRKSELTDFRNLRLMLKISYTGCLGLFPAISSQFNVERCAASKNCEKFTKKALFGKFKVIQGHRCW